MYLYLEGGWRGLLCHSCRIPKRRRDLWGGESIHALREGALPRGVRRGPCHCVGGVCLEDLETGTHGG